MGKTPPIFTEMSADSLDTEPPADKKKDGEIEELKKLLEELKNRKDNANEQQALNAPPVQEVPTEAPTEVPTPYPTEAPTEPALDAAPPADKKKDGEIEELKKLLEELKNSKDNANEQQALNAPPVQEVATE